MPRLEPKHLAALREMAAEAPLEVETTGGCMMPLLEDGARVRVAPRRTYWPGDVVVLHAADDLRAHRVIGWVPGRGGWRVVTQSDAAGSIAAGGHDDPVGRDQIVGRIIGGECSAALARIPLRHRLTALARFARQVARSLRRRL